jgi:LPXTG-motif cell wall-anchored protein
VSTALLRRRGAARVFGVLASCALAGTGIVVSTTAASAEEESVTESLQTFAAEAFAPQADELPSGLIEAIERDLGISPAEYLANAASAKVTADVVAQLEDAGVNINATVISGQDVTLYVAAEADVDAALAVGAEVEVGDAPATDTPDEIVAHEDLKGGYGYMSPESGRCSIGFNGYAADGSPVVITAGHCNPDNSDFDWYLFDVDAPMSPDSDDPWPQGEQIGSGGEFQFGENHDAGLFPVTNPAWTPRPVVSSWGGGNGDPRDGEVAVTDDTTAIKGAPVCRSGASTGYQCGEVYAVNQSVLVDDVPVTGFFTTACSAQGDSGGSFLTGTAAVGTLTGGSGDAPTDCAQWDPEQFLSFAYATSGSEFSQESFYGDAWELAVQIATPAVSSPEDGGESGPSVTFAGTVEGAGANHRVEVSVDGGEPVEGAVAANGSFSVPLDGDLEPGEHSYSVRAFYGAHSQSEAAEGSWTVNEAPAVAELTVASPTDGQTTGNARPEFNGTGQPGATIALTVGDAEFGTTEIGEDGSWTLAPSSDLPVGVRFDAVVTQTFEDDTQKATVAGLGINAPEVTITAPEDGSTVAGDVNFEGGSFGGATIGLLLEQSTDAADAQPRLGLRAEGDDDVEEWAGEFEIDDAGNWTFNPAEDLPEGEYTITASATLEGGDPELSDSEAVATFTVENAGGGDDDGDGDLPDTGSSNTTWMIVGGVLLLVAGGAAVAVRARRNTTA